MAIQLQVRRGDTAQNDAFTGAVGELSVNTDTSAIRVHDGVTAGGVELARSSQIDSLLSKSVAGAVDVTLSAGEAGNSNHEYTGILTGDINVIVPAVSHNFTAENLTTGAYTLTVKTAAGVGVLIPQGQALQLYCNGTDVEDSNSAKADKSGTTFTGPVVVPTATASTQAVQLGQTMGKNIIINGGFTINQRGQVSGAALSAGAYGHDRWKGGGSGGDYSFTQLASNTQVTIAANKSLVQIIEDKNVQSTSYVLSWEGTAQGRVTINSATPSGTFEASPIVVTGQTVGTVMCVEFSNGASAGTLGKVQLEAGSVATTFESRPYTTELALCQRYYEAQTLGGIYVATDGTNNVFNASWQARKRTAPTMTLTGFTPTALSGTVDNWYGYKSGVAFLNITAVTGESEL